MPSSEIQLRRTGRIAILGAGSEGRSVIEYLEGLGCEDVTVCDKDETVRLPEWVQPQLGDGYLGDLSRFEVIFRSPGVPRDLASIVDAEAAGARITSATKEFFAHCPCTIIGITGSNGKTTTTDLIGDILRHTYGGGLHVGGNDHGSLLTRLPEIARDQVVVLELSSFQLYDLDESPPVSVVLNVTPNHLDVHSSFQDYLSAKENIVRHQTPEHYAVLNWAFTIVRDLAKRTQAKIRYLNNADCEAGAFEREGRVILRDEAGDVSLIAATDLPRFMNVDNLLAAAVVGRLFDVPVEAIRETVRQFRGVPHRMQLIREIDGVGYYDDSASTTPESSINALRSFPEAKTVLIAGGVDKRLKYDSLAKEVVRTQARTVLIGEARVSLEQTVREMAERLGVAARVQVADDLEGAIRAAREMARSGDVVVLSPGFASFDMFPDSKARGDAFQKLVEKLGGAR